jgi:hypothetical protein
VASREVFIGDEMDIDGVWHRITDIEHGLRLRSADGVRILSVAVIANGSSWNVAERMTRPAEKR